MRFLSLSVIHARMAARQRAIWVASLLLALLSMGVAVNTGLPFETGDVASPPSRKASRAATSTSPTRCS